MGCYGHFFVERKQVQDWVCLFQWYGPQDYQFFSVLAGVRNDEKHPIFPIAEPKGFPLDASWQVKSAYEDGGDQADTHNASWLTFDEIFSYKYWMSFPPRLAGMDEEETLHDICRPFMRDVVYLLRHLKMDRQRITKTDMERFVFWFDG